MPDKYPIHIELTEADHTILLVSLGMAIQACLRHEDKEFAQHILFLANRINKNNPDWEDYKTLDDLPENLRYPFGR